MPFPTTSVLSAFTAADGLLSTQIPAFGGDFDSTSASAMRVLSNQAGQTVAGFESTYWTTSTFGPDCEVFIDLAVVEAGTNEAVFLLARLQTPHTAGVDGYGLAIDPSANHFDLYRIDNASQTVLTSLTQAVASGDSVGLAVVGSQLQAWYKPAAGAWTQVGTFTDATYPAAGNIGFETRDTINRLDNFGGGSIVASGSPVARVRIPNPRVGPMALRRRAMRVRTFAAPTGATQQTLTLTGTVTPTGALVKQGQKPLSGTATPAGTLARGAQKVFAGTAAPVGALMKQAVKLLTGSVTPAGTPSRQTQKTLTGTVTPTGTLVKAVSKLLTGTLSAAGTLLAQSVKLLNLSGTVTPVGTLVKRPSKILTGSVTPAGALSRSVGKALGGAVTPAGALVKSTTKILAGAVTAAGSLVVRGVKLLVLSGTVTPTGTLAKQVQKPLSGAVTAAGTLRKVATKALGGAATPVGSLAKQTRKALSGTVTAAGSLLAQIATTAAAIATTLTRSHPGSGLTRRGGTGSGLTGSSPSDGRTRTDPASGRTTADGGDGDTRSDLGGS